MVVFGGFKNASRPGTGTSYGQIEHVCATIKAKSITFSQLWLTFDKATFFVACRNAITDQKKLSQNNHRQY